MSKLHTVTAIMLTIAFISLPKHTGAVESYGKSTQSISIISDKLFNEKIKHKDNDSYTLGPVFIQNDNILINLFDEKANIQKRITPERKDWYKAINPDKIPLLLEININNVGKVALFDNLAEHACINGDYPTLILHNNFYENDSSRSIRINIKAPCFRYYSQYAQCPQEAVLMVRVKTKDGRYFYNTKRIYTCLLSGTS